MTKELNYDVISLSTAEVLWLNIKQVKCISIFASDMESEKTIVSAFVMQSNTK